MLPPNLDHDDDESACMRVEASLAAWPFAQISGMGANAVREHRFLGGTTPVKASKVYWKQNGNYSCIYTYIKYSACEGRFLGPVRPSKSDQRRYQSAVTDNVFMNGHGQKRFKPSVRAHNSPITASWMS
jgi:hypothetical protein